MEERILAVIKAKKAAKIGDFVDATGFSRVYINRFIKKLIVEKKIVRIGATNKVRYVLFGVSRLFMGWGHGGNIWMKKIANKNLQEDLIFNQIKAESTILLGLPVNVTRIVEYAFTEMLNNAIEHSRAKHLLISFMRQDHLVSFDVQDFGIGIFNNIISKRHLHSELEAVQDLIKGKQTTAPALHSGEGIFFTSKAVDSLIIASGRTELTFDNSIPDIFIKQRRLSKGTRVICMINAKNKRQLVDIFNMFSSGPHHIFDKTEIKVRLFTIDSNFVSRSQARRLLAGLDKFKKIILDFDRVTDIGQGFADEIFRVFKQTHPDKIIEATNTNPEIDFMIKRAKR